VIYWQCRMFRSYLNNVWEIRNSGSGMFIDGNVRVRCESPELVPIFAFFELLTVGE
jgi:hypothetical protein